MPVLNRAPEIDELRVTAGDVDRAMTVLRDEAARTRVRSLPNGIQVKCENEQVTGSFKIRGATNAIAQLQPREVVTGSSGNHGKAIAYVARRSAIPATIVMTQDARPEKSHEVEALGAEIVWCKGGTEARNQLAQCIAAERGAAYISSYDDPLVVAGQGTLALELLEDVPNIGAIFVPVGGGGLLAGVAVTVKSRYPEIEIIGVEPERGDDTIRSMKSGMRVRIPRPATICDGARAQVPGQLTFSINRLLVDEIIAVSDMEVLRAMEMLAVNGIVGEPTGCLSVAGAVLAGVDGGALAIVSGGNMTPAESALLRSAASTRRGAA